MSMSDLPSKTTHVSYLQVPPGIVVESHNEWKECGKWMILNPTNDLEWIDKVWTDLQELLRNGCLIMLKASTLKSKLEIGKKKYTKKMDSGIVMCFTRPGKEAAKTAAEEIRKIIHHECLMYYKKNKTTDAGIGHRFGDTHVSDYMHTFQGRFYIRGADLGWTWDAHNEEEKDKILSFEENLGDIGLEHLPSHSMEQNFYYVLKPVIRQGDGYWQVNCTPEDGIRLTEADRVWVTAKKFFDTGLFTNISYHKNPKVVHICMYVADYSDVNALTKACDDVLKSACHYGFGHFYIATRLFDNGKFLNEIKYSYTAEGELYEVVKNNVTKFIMHNK